MDTTDETTPGAARRPGDKEIIERWARIARAALPSPTLAADPETGRVVLRAGDESAASAERAFGSALELERFGPDVLSQMAAELVRKAAWAERSGRLAASAEARRVGAHAHGAPAEPGRGAVPRVEMFALDAGEAIEGALGELDRRPSRPSVMPTASFDMGQIAGAEAEREEMETRPFAVGEIEERVTRLRQNTGEDARSTLVQAPGAHQAHHASRATVVDPGAHERSRSAARLARIAQDVQDALRGASHPQAMADAVGSEVVVRLYPGAPKIHIPEAELRRNLPRAISRAIKT